MKMSLYIFLSLVCLFSFSRGLYLPGLAPNNFCYNDTDYCSVFSLYQLLESINICLNAIYVCVYLCYVVSSGCICESIGFGTSNTSL